MPDGLILRCVALDANETFFLGNFKRLITMAHGAVIKHGEIELFILLKSRKRSATRTT